MFTGDLLIEREGVKDDVRGHCAGWILSIQLGRYFKIEYFLPHGIFIVLGPVQ
ncbi:hypothetical protein [Marinomonas algicola]|uniref:hypothetical protein n=1 Tax=Marinomonas algicola TaxID=2773454 RepID=UPI001748B82A|nr:hypothetical protein [Marinomonas algicola]